MPDHDLRLELRKSPNPQPGITIQLDGHDAAAYSVEYHRVPSWWQNFRRTRHFRVQLGLEIYKAVMNLYYYFLTSSTEPVDIAHTVRVTEEQLAYIKANSPCSF